MRSIDSKFYKSKAWQTTRALYIAQHPLCEECLKHGRYTLAEHVHHKTWLNAQNVNDPEISLSFNNLEAVCHDCHNKIHSGNINRRYNVTKDGKVEAVY